MLYKSAYTSYQKEVVGNGKLYHRYVNDFLNSHTYADCFDATGMNIHQMNLGIMNTLLRSRRDLVELYFNEKSFTREHFVVMQRMLDTTKVPGTDPVGHHYSEDADEIPYTFECMFTPTQMSLITRCANETHLFSHPVTEQEMESLFSCNPERPLKSANNRRVAIFFDSLCERNLICKQWQLVIATHGLVLSSANSEPLKCGNISTALNEAKASAKSIYDTIRKMAKEIAENSKKDTNNVI